MFGVFFHEAPQDWQILQQENGRAEIFLSGVYVPPVEPPLPEPRVLLRVVREADGQTVTDWQQAALLPERKWKGVLSVPAGGLYRLESVLINAGNPVYEWGLRGDMRHHIGVGDLFVIAGQSNSAGYGKDPVFDPPELGVHLLRNSMRWDLAAHPLNDSTDSAHPISAEGANPGNSPYLRFGKLMKQELGYPIGLLQTSLGGTSIARWDPARNGDLYRSMMDVIRSQGGRVKGTLWYQGCSDGQHPDADVYEHSFSRMVSTFREEMQATVPFLTVQLNRCTDVSTAEKDEAWGMIREAQRAAAKKLPAVSVVSSTDLSLSDVIHNTASSNVVLGERLAGAALRDIYGRTFSSPAPDITDAVAEDETHLYLTFAPVLWRLDANEAPAHTREVWTVSDAAGENEVTEMEYVSVNRIRLTLRRPSECGCTVSMGWQTSPPRSVPFDAATHIPALSFYCFPVRMK